MVSRNRKFPTPHGYSRSVAKRDAELSVQDALYGSGDAGNRSTQRDQRLPGPDRHVAFDIGPRVPISSGLDIRAAVHDSRHGIEVHRDRQPHREDPEPASPAAWWTRLWHWLSWR